MMAEYVWQVSLSGHLFDKFLINEALDIIEAAGGFFHLVNCHVGQSVNAISYSELEVSTHFFKLECLLMPLKKIFFYWMQSTWITEFHIFRTCKICGVIINIENVRRY